MNELLQEFWEAWKERERYRDDYRVYGCDPSGRLAKIRAIAKRIEAAERAALVAQANVSDDVPGQMYFEDISTPMPVATVAKGAA